MIYIAITCGVALQRVVVIPRGREMSNPVQTSGRTDVSKMNYSFSSVRNPPSSIFTFHQHEFHSVEHTKSLYVCLFVSNADPYCKLGIWAPLCSGEIRNCEAFSFCAPIPRIIHLHFSPTST